MTSDAPPTQLKSFLDFIDKIFKNKITLFILLCGKELLRCKKIYAAVDKDGINHFPKEIKLTFIMCRRSVAGIYFYLRIIDSSILVYNFKILSQKGFGKL